MAAAKRIVALCGGVGGAKLAYGLSKLLEPDELSIVVNTGDDFEHLGLTICPDIDTVIYTLAGLADEAQGWGRADEHWTVMQELQRLGGETWFRLGDRDMALHLLRAQLQGGGLTHTQITAHIARQLGVRNTVLPMCDEPVRTVVETDAGPLLFQDYFVRLRCEPRASGFIYSGVENARLTSQVCGALAQDGLRGVIVCPSNPYLSIAPILSVPGIRQRLRECAAPVLAVSPIVGGRALKGPAAKMMAEIGAEISGLSVARMYADFLDAMLLDVGDAQLARQTSSADPQLVFAQSVMRTREDRITLARECLRLLDSLQGRAQDRIL